MKEQELRDKLVGLWMGDVGQRETNGNNRSPLIDSINKDIGSGASSAAPYCIAGLLIRGVKRMCAELGLKNPVFMTSGTQAFYDRAPAKYRRQVPEKGDIGILVKRSDSGHGHAFGIREAANEKYLTVEYNTDAEGSRDGDGVWSKTRFPAGSGSMRMRGFVDVVAMIMDANGGALTKPVEAPATDVGPLYMKMGSTGAAVKELQLTLKELGYDLTGTGTFGAKTDKALKAFQLRSGLTADGELGPKTKVALIGVVAPKTGLVTMGALPWGLSHRDWDETLITLVAKSHLPDLIPVDIDSFNVRYRKTNREGRVAFWVHFISKMTEYESGFKIGSILKESSGIDSLGLLQVSTEDLRNYRLSFGYSRADLLAAIPNLTLGVAIIDSLVTRHGRVAGKVGGVWKGGSAYWSVLRDTRPSFAKIQKYVKGLAL